MREEAPKPMVNRERVQTVIDRIRPVIQADGGDIELVDVVDNKARVRMSGNCIGCPSAQMTLYMGIELALKDEIPEFEELLNVGLDDAIDSLGQAWKPSFSLKSVWPLGAFGVVARLDQEREEHALKTART